MKPHITSLINALVLIGLGLWAWIGTADPSKTVLITVGVGAVLLTLNRGIKKENRHAAHFAVLLTLIILAGLVKPLTGAFERSDRMAIIRVSIMMASTLLALLSFIKSFVKASRARAKAE